MMKYIGYLESRMKYLGYSESITKQTKKELIQISKTSIFSLQELIKWFNAQEGDPVEILKLLKKKIEICYHENKRLT